MFHFLFCRIPKAGPEAMMCLLRSNVYSKSPHVKEWVFCTSVQSCPLQHPAGVAMVTFCNLALTHRSRHTLLFQGQMHLLNALIVPSPPSQWGYVQSQRYAGTSPFGSKFPGEIGVNLSWGSGPMPPVSWRTLISEFLGFGHLMLLMPQSRTGSHPCFYLLFSVSPEQGQGNSYQSFAP